MELTKSQPSLAEQKLITELKNIINSAQDLPISELCKEGNYNNPNLEYPQTKGERIVNDALNLLMNQPNTYNNPTLDEIESILGPLDTGANKPNCWKELFKIGGRL